MISAWGVCLFMSDNRVPLKRDSVEMKVSFLTRGILIHFAKLPIVAYFVMSYLVNRGNSRGK